MTAVAAYPPPPLIPPFAFSTPPNPRRPISEGQHVGGRARSGEEARAGQKRALTPRGEASTAMKRSGTRDGDESGSLSGTPIARPRSWLRRLSSSMSTSRESSQASHSRPSSAAVSYSNGSMAISHSGSTTPIFPDTRTPPPPSQPNKLVKRTSSLPGGDGSPLLSSTSRLPMPVFRRPATSHQRSATMQGHLRGELTTTAADSSGTSTPARDAQLRSYFTPRIAAGENPFTRSRSSTGIPNPVKRVYPDRRYTPILVSGRNMITPARTELDDRLSVDDEVEEVTRLAIAPSVASSPLPAHTSQFEAGQIAKRSFSIGDLLSTGPQSQPLWTRPSSSQRSPKLTSTKLTRRARPRVASAPHAPMGNGSSRDSGADTEPPAKRRDLTDPRSGGRSIYLHANGNTQLDLGAHEIDLQLFSQTAQSHTFGSTRTPFAENLSNAQTPSPPEQQRLPSATLASAAGRPSRVSAARSEITSTIGSDSDFQSIGDASTDCQSDAFYDSYPTRTTRSSSGRRRPHIESIFDDSPPNFSSGRSTRLKDLLNEGTFPAGEHISRNRHSTIEEEGSIVSTPVRSVHTQSMASTPSARPGAQQLFGSSPPGVAMTDPDEIDWDAFDDETGDNGLGIQAASSHPRATERPLPFRFGPALQRSGQGSISTTPQRSNGDRANLFEWAEVQPSPSHNQSPPRPKTVHGKKDPDSRGSRTTGRRAPSGMHARSHSVPVVPDVDGKRPSAVANKFGTWGVGSKAVTEDWNEDFDFEEPPSSSVETLKQDERRIDSGHEMFVPRSIREQQENVVANISLLREWGLLIEELKELRVRAVALDMMSGPYAQAWYEVDAMIELADQETEEQTLEPRRSPPSSPGFDYGEFDAPIPSIASTTRTLSLGVATVSEVDNVAMLPRTSPPPATPQQNLKASRPRKDSEAVARSVIEALQTRRAVSDPTALKAPAPAKKVPFDTATLRHIVPYVNGLKRKVKDALRETEGLYSSPRRRVPLYADAQQTGDQGPAFRSIFNEPDPDSSSAFRLSRREEAATDHNGDDDPWLEYADQGELTARLRDMKLPKGRDDTPA